MARLGIVITAQQVTIVQTGPGASSPAVRMVQDDPLITYASLLEEFLSTEWKAKNREDIKAMGFDVSDLLETHRTTEVTVIRVAPRPPADSYHAPTIDYSEANVTVVNIAGGHGAQGRVLRPLDESALREHLRQHPQGGIFVVAAVGAGVNPDHERRVGEIIHELCRPEIVEYSHSFFSESIGIRERTAVINALLRATASGIATAITLMTGRMLPHAKLYVTGNEGGCFPLTRLSVLPVHCMYSWPANLILGVADTMRISEGNVAFQIMDTAYQAEMIAGVLTVTPTSPHPASQRIATTCVHTVTQGTQPALSRLADLPVTFTAELPHQDSASGKVVQGATHGLVALGAALAPLSDVTSRTVVVRSAAELTEIQQQLENRVRTRLVSFGAQPSRIYMVDSQSAPSTYSVSDLVSLRVRAVELAIASWQEPVTS